MTFRYQVAGRVATLTLASPARRNALSLALLAALEKGVVQAVADDAVRVVVLTAEGPSFCAGADLVELAGAEDAAERSRWTAQLTSALRALYLCPKPTVARINGTARAGGVGLIAACDIAIACESSTYGLPEVRLGTVPAVIAIPLFRRVSYSRALQYCLTGEVFGADEAVASGLVTRVVADAELDEETTRYVQMLLQGGSRALAMTKAIARTSPAMDIDRAFTEMERLSAEIFDWSEAKEGISAFRKRPID